jgi:hypothetical protein
MFEFIKKGLLVVLCVAVVVLACMVIWFGRQAVMAAPPCTEPRSGIIGDGESAALHGPFLVTSLIGLQDPASTSRAFVIWTRDNVWMPTDEFKGPFYLAEKDRLIGRKDFTKYNVAYSGYACH